MTKLMKSLLVLLATVLTVSDARRIRSWPLDCSDVLGRRCIEDFECECVTSRPSPSLICNYRSRCEVESFLDDIYRNLPCPLTFKSSCTEDADCTCNEALLICERRECVRPKPNDWQQIYSNVQ